ncbi:MAG: hypothetical protein KDA65_02075 [Planctomycetaceae bacterium]|nr:hypothetical protein [Planctomycetaceae bacterium]
MNRMISMYTLKFMAIVNLLIFLLQMATPAFAQDANGKVFVPIGSISVEIKPLLNRCRPQSPMPSTFVVYNNFQQILTGDLVIEGIENQNTLFTYRTPVTFVEGEQKFRVLLPLHLYRPATGQVELQLYLETKDRKFDLDIHPVQVPVFGSEYFMAGYIMPNLGQFSHEIESYRLKLNQMEKWLAYAEVLETQEDSQRSYQAKWQRTLFSELNQLDFPERPIELTCFDLITISGEAYNELNEKQLAALTQWIKAGGNLLLFLPDEVDLEHVETLNNLTNLHDGEEFFFINIDNRLQWDTDKNDAPLFLRPFLLRNCGLGRVAFVKSEILENPIQYHQERLETYLFLWRVRKEIADRLRSKSLYQLQIETGENEFDGPSELKLSGFNNFSGFNRSSLYQFRRRMDDFSMEEQLLINQQMLAEGSLSAEELWVQDQHAWRNLLPHGFNLVPPVFVMGLMFFYLLLVGPGDYWLLGALRKRKWTWLSFPLITIVFTYITVHSINAYMQIENPERKLIVTDVGKAGDVLRQSSFTCILSPSQQINTTTYNRELTIPVDIAQSWLNDDQLQNLNNVYTGQTSDPPLFSGSLTGEYSLTQPLQKWSPKTFIGFDIPSVTESSDSSRWNHTPEFWKALSWEMLGDRPAIQSLARQHFPNPVVVEVMDQQQINEDDPDLEFSCQALMHTIDFTRNFGLFGQMHSIAPRPGSFQANQIVGDFQDPSQILVRVMWEEGDLLHVERCLFHDESAP